MTGQFLGEFERTPHRVARVRIGRGAEYQLTAVRLADVDMQRSRDDDSVEELLHRLGHCRLERMGDERHLQTDHHVDQARPACGAVDHGSSGDPAPVRVDRNNPTIGSLDRLHFGLLVDLAAANVGSPGVAPVDRVMADRASGRVIQRAHDRVPGVLRGVHVGHQLLDLVRPDHVRIDAFELVHLGSPPHRAQRRIVVRQGEVAHLAEHDVEVQICRETFVQLHGTVVEPDALRGEVVGAHDRGVAPGAPAAHVPLVEDGDVGDAVVLGEVVGGGQPMHASADDDNVVARLQLVVAPYLRPVTLHQPVLDQAERRILRGILHLAHARRHSFTTTPAPSRCRREGSEPLPQPRS